MAGGGTLSKNIDSFEGGALTTACVIMGWKDNPLTTDSPKRIECDTRDPAAFLSEEEGEYFFFINNFQLDFMIGGKPVTIKTGQIDQLDDELDNASGDFFFPGARLYDRVEIEHLMASGSITPKQLKMIRQESTSDSNLIRGRHGGWYAVPSKYTLL